jgi:hypothetical protein
MSENVFFLVIFLSFVFSVVQFSLFIMRRIKKRSRNRIEIGNFLQDQRRNKKMEKLSDIPSSFLE